MDVQAEAVEFCAFDNSYARLPERFFTRLPPTPVAAPRLVRLNTKLALDLGLDPDRLATPEGLEMLAGNLVPQAIACANTVAEAAHIRMQLDRLIKDDKAAGAGTADGRLR
jgi:serine/tyrosine/threonine adenylyltransferase